jgi:probable phosphomutase (TIGR03848 family)
MPRRRTADRPVTVCWVRHGTTPTTGKVLPGRARGLHLSEQGRVEAKEAGQRLEGVPVSAIYASPLERARETAAEIASQLEPRVTIDRALVECDFGDWTGAELAKLSKLPEWKTVQRMPSAFSFPSGESFLDMQARLADAVVRYRVRHPGEVIVAVSHADCIKAALATALGVPLDLFQRIMVGTCSTSVVTYGGEGTLVHAVNSYGPIRKLLGTGAGSGQSRSQPSGKVPER